MKSAPRTKRRLNQLFPALAALLLLPLNVMAQQAGDPDSSFGTNGKVFTDISGDNDEGQDVALQSDGKIVVAGYAPNVSPGSVQFALVRYLPDGSLDPGFGAGGIVLTSFGSVNALARTVVVQPDGAIIAGGYTTDNNGLGGFALARYLPDGALDTTFDGDGLLTLNIGLGAVYDIVLRPDSRIVVVGNGGLVGLHADGTFDATFGAGGLVPTDFEPFTAELQADGRIVAVGKFTNTDPFERGFALGRFLPDGSLDPTFGTGGRVNTSVGGDGTAVAMTLQADGKVVAAGESLSPGVNFTLVRYLPDGSLDATFGGDGVVTTDFGVGIVSAVTGVRQQADGKIVAAGFGGLARYLPDGSLDSTFGGDGIVHDYGGSGLVIQPDGRLVVGGLINHTGGEGAIDFAAARYLAAAVPGVGPPTNKNQCKNNGWRTFTIPRTFKSEGDCIRFVLTGQ